MRSIRIYILKKWKNKTFGDSGKFYPLLYCLPLPIFGISTFLLIYSFASGFQTWEQLVIIGFGLFFAMYAAKSVEAIVVARSTIQEISYDGHWFRGRTFGGKTFDVDKFSETSENRALFSKKHLKFLFPANTNNMVLHIASDDFYLSGNISGIDSLRALIFENCEYS